jgi:simple sugar transport system permease protein
VLEEFSLDKPTDKTSEKKRSFWSRVAMREGKGEAILLPVLSVFTALVVGAFIIPFSDPNVLAAKGFMETLSASWAAVRNAYSAMFTGAFGDPKTISAAFQAWQATGETKGLLNAFRPVSESLTIATPYIYAGLGVALGFRGGLFNIGAEGQLFVAGLAAAFVGYSITGLPFLIHLPLALVSGALMGALWASVPGFLKARTGAHEVINTIMMNYIAFRLTDYLLSGPMQRPDGLPITPNVLPTSYLPLLFAEPMRVHWGFIIALALAGVVYWFLWKTPLGLEIRMVGANPNASRYAGIRITLITVLTMALSGALTGMAGVGQILGVDHKLVRAFSSGYGFDAISLALLGNSHPFGVVLAALLFGFLRGGAARMQSVAGTPVELIRIIQGLVIVFVAAPEIIRTLYRIGSSRKQKSAS